jgi:hypothetical protein
MIETYKHFKKRLIVFLGLDTISILEISCLIVPLIYLSSFLELKLNSPLLLFLTAIVIIISTLIIKANSGDEVEGFYSSILTHPFKNHIFPYGRNEDYDSLIDLQSIKDIKEDFFINKENDLIGILKLKNTLALKLIEPGSKIEFLDHWKNYLAEMKSVRDWSSYFDIHSGGDLLQIFTEIESYKFRGDEYFQKIFENKFVPNPNFYIIYKHKVSESTIKRFLYKNLSLFFKRENLDETEISNQKIKLKNKLNTLQTVFQRMGIETIRLETESLKIFIYKYMPALNPNKKDSLIDKNKYLNLGTKYTKVFRLTRVPDSANLNFWLHALINQFPCDSYISIHIESRDALADLEKCRFRTEFFGQCSKSNPNERKIFLEETKKINHEILDTSCSFDLSVYIVLSSDSLETIKNTENLFRRTIMGACFASLDRMQVENWIYSLPFGFNKLNNRSKLFSGLGFVGSLFNCIEEQIGTEEGVLLGFSRENKKAIFLDESNRKFANNKMINFIGDSGSGKSVAAKASIKRRLEKGSSFVIVDNTKDGWNFFIDYMKGQLIEVSPSKQEKSFFNPFNYKKELEDFNSHILSIVKILTIIKSKDIQLSSKEENFLIKSLQNLYTSVSEPCLSDLYMFWNQQKNNSDNQEFLSPWIESITPYTKMTDGIYSGLMDGKNALIDENTNLQLITFSKLENNSTFLELSIALIVIEINKRLLNNNHKNLYLVIDEAWKIFHSSKAREVFSYFTRAGRALGLGLWMISQKPSDLPREIHSSASNLICFQLKEKQDRVEVSNLANLNTYEKSLLDSPELFRPGVCFIKSVKDSGLVDISLNPEEKIICNSDRDFVDKREELFQKKLQLQPNRSLAAKDTVGELLNA